MVALVGDNDYNTSPLHPKSHVKVDILMDVKLKEHLLKEMVMRHKPSQICRRKKYIYVHKRTFRHYMCLQTQFSFKTQTVYKLAVG